MPTVLIFVFDGLQPAQVTPELMPSQVFQLFHMFHSALFRTSTSNG